MRAYALVDDEDYEELNKHQWSAGIHRGVMYARRGVEPLVYMHRQIMATPEGMYTDHIDGNTLNNQKTNLRVCTNAQNLWNRGKTKNNTTGYRGVSFHKPTGKYRARLTFWGREIYLGLFKNIKVAVDTHAKAMKDYYGEFAKT